MFKGLWGYEYMLRVSVGFLAAVGFSVIFGQAQAMSLREAVQQAVLTNPRIEAAQANQRASRYGLDQAKGRLFPEIELNADTGAQRIDRPNGLGPDVNDQWNNRRQVTLSIRQVLFDGWDRANDIYRSQATISAESYRVLVRSEVVGLSSVEAYIDVVRHNDLLALANDNVRRHQALLRIIRERFEGGKSPIGDLEQTVERVEAAKALVAQIKVAQAAAHAKFKNAVGISPSRLHSVSYAKGIPKSVEEVTNLALHNNPRVMAALADTDATFFEQQQFRSTLLPQVYLEGNATRGEDLEGTPGRNDEYGARVVLRWKLFDGGVRRSRVSELGERHSEKIAEQLILGRQLTEEVEVSWARLVDGRAQVEAVKRESDQDAKVVATYKDEYNANKRSLLDVLDAENARFNTQFELSNIEALHVFSSYELLALMGKLLESLDVNAPQIPELESGPLPSLFQGSSKGYTIPSLSQK